MGEEIDKSEGWYQAKRELEEKSAKTFAEAFKSFQRGNIEDTKMKLGFSLGWKIAVETIEFYCMPEEAE